MKIEELKKLCDLSMCLWKDTSWDEDRHYDDVDLAFEQVKPHVPLLVELAAAVEQVFSVLSPEDENQAIGLEKFNAISEANRRLHLARIALEKA